MKTAWFLLLIVFIGQTTVAQAVLPIGQWRDHLPMRNVLSLSTDGATLFAGTNYGYFAFNPSTKELTVRTKSTGLSQVDLRILSKNPTRDVVLLAYLNADLDLIKGDQIRNLPDLTKGNSQEDRMVNHISWIGDDAYLSTNIGIVVVDTRKSEIKNTYRFGEGGSSIKVFQTTLLNGVLFAATQIGLYSVSLSSSSLNDFRNWKQVNINKPNSTVQRVVNWNNHLVAQQQDTLFISKDGKWDFLFANAQSITALDVVSNQLFVGNTAQSKGSIVLINQGSFSIQQINSASLTYPTAGVYVDGSLWIADLQNGIINISDDKELPVFPETPGGFANGQAIFANQEIFIAAGKLIDQFLQTGSKNAFYSFRNGNWKTVNQSVYAAIDSLNDITSLAYNYATGSIYSGAENGGLLEITKEGKAVVYKQNSFLAPAINSPSRFSVGGLCMDRDQQLWLTNNGASQGLIVLKKDGKAQKFTIPFSYTNLGLSKLIVDDQNRKWIIAANADGLFCFDHGSSIENNADDRWRHFKQGLGQGNLPSNNVKSIAVDRNDFIWVGTDKGIAVIQCSDEVFNSGACEAVLPVVQQDNFAGRLLAEEQINDIAVDGADRKWVATNNGVWLLSADGQQVISRFTSANSDLLNNVVSSLVIHPETGEVFFMTQKGICSYRGTAIAPVEVMKKPFVFPNPVPPGYSGTIAIRDLPENAWVSITELDGRLVYKTRSLGGQAIWNGKNYNGQRLSSGTYLIIVSNAFNSQQVAGKIFFLK